MTSKLTGAGIVAQLAEGRPKPSRGDDSSSDEEEGGSLSLTTSYYFMTLTEYDIHIRAYFWGYKPARELLHTPFLCCCHPSMVLVLQTRNFLMVIPDMSGAGFGSCSYSSGCVANGTSRIDWIKSAALPVF